MKIPYRETHLGLFIPQPSVSAGILRVNLFRFHIHIYSNPSRLALEQLRSCCSPAALRIEQYGQIWQGLHYAWDIEGVIDAFLDVLFSRTVLTPVLLKLRAIYPLENLTKTTRLTP